MKKPLDHLAFLRAVLYAWLIIPFLKILRFYRQAIAVSILIVQILINGVNAQTNVTVAERPDRAFLREEIDQLKWQIN